MIYKNKQQRATSDSIPLPNITKTNDNATIEISPKINLKF
jgi:hypothetical protein